MSRKTVARFPRVTKDQHDQSLGLAIRAQATRKVSEAQSNKIKPGTYEESDSHDSFQSELRSDLEDEFRDTVMDRLELNSPGYKYDETERTKIFKKGDIFCHKEAKNGTKT